MTQWLLEKRLVALNTMYKKVFQKQVTYRSPKNDENQLEYILLDKKHQSWIRDAESTDILYMGSDHRCVMAKFEITAKEAKGQPRQSKALMKERQNETDEDEKQQEYLDIEQEVKDRIKEEKKNRRCSRWDYRYECGSNEKRRKNNWSRRKSANDASAAQVASAGNESTSKREAEATEGPAAFAGKTVATDASGAHAAAALDEDVEKRQAVEDRTKFRRFWKRWKMPKTYPVSNQWRNEFSSPESKTKMAKQKKRGKASQMYLKSFTKICTKERKNMKTKTWNHVPNKKTRNPARAKQSQSSQRKKYKRPSIVWIKGTRETAVEYAQKKWKSAAMTRKKRYGSSSMKLHNGKISPKNWRRIRIQVIHKKGDREDPGNYRPKCGLPILYKIFATVPYARFAPSLHHRCEYHLIVLWILE